ncbi:uridylate kinase [Methylobacterium sp. 10]|uniref:amino acid kinase family protein n=1 Tax=Methylobacterium sp. 10 TaxID=1101191 RepID=UPI00047F17D8|nr:uridylate kinase [Methylobacterium sp. 10]
MTGAPPTIVKLGGSLVSDAARLGRLLAALADGGEGRCVVVPGGGPFADAVRQAQGQLGFSDALAHRLALDCMGRMAEVLSECEPRLAIVRSVMEARSAEAPIIWDPVALKDGHPSIRESWDVTSDSLALWLATELEAPRCILVKSIDRPTGASLSDLARMGMVDAAFPGFAASYAGEIVIRGPDADIVRAAA